MQIENNKAKPRVGVARQMARKIIQGMGATEPPILIDRVYKYLQQKGNYKLEIIKFDFDGSRIDGQTATVDDTSLIGYNQDKHVHRKRFTVAHEIGHLVLGHTGKSSEHIFNVFSIECGNPKEAEANQFAAELMVPLSMLKRDIENGIKRIDDLAQRYWISREVMLIKIMDSGLLDKVQ